MYIDTDLPCIQVMIYAGLRAPRPDRRENVYVGRCPTPRSGTFLGKRTLRTRKTRERVKEKGKVRRRNVCLCGIFAEKDAEGSASRSDMRENVYVGRCPTPRLGFF